MPNPPLEVDIDLDESGPPLDGEDASSSSTVAGLTEVQASLPAETFLSGLPWNGRTVDADRMNPDVFLRSFE